MIRSDERDEALSAMPSGKHKKHRTRTEGSVLRDAVAEMHRNGNPREAIAVKHGISLARVSVLLRQAGVFGRSIVFRKPLLPDSGLSFEERTRRAKFEMQRRKIQDRSRPTMMEQRESRQRKRAQA